MLVPAPAFTVLQKQSFFYADFKIDVEKTLCFGYVLRCLHFSLNPGEQENIDKFSKRLVKVTKQHNDECKQLLTLMGVPYIEVRSALMLLYNCDTNT